MHKTGSTAVCWVNKTAKSHRLRRWKVVLLHNSEIFIYSFRSKYTFPQGILSSAKYPCNTSWLSFLLFFTVLLRSSLEMSTQLFVSLDPNIHYLRPNLVTLILPYWKKNVVELWLCLLVCKWESPEGTTTSGKMRKKERTQSTGVSVLN